MKEYSLAELKAADANMILSAIQRMIPDAELMEQFAYARGWIRFWQKVEENPVTGCWEWTGALHHGYGSGSINRHSYDAHRLAWQFLHGPIAQGMHLDHLREVCHTTRCVNAYRHLQAVTPAINVYRGKSIFADKARQTHCLRGHEFDGIDKRGHRTCSQCHKITDANRPPRKRKGTKQ